MNNFIFHNPTRLLFGKGMISKLGELLPREVKVLVTFGGGSVKRNGVYDQVIAAGLCTEVDAWDLVLSKEAFEALPLGTVLTLPATGSEMNNGAVISRAETHEKLDFYTRYPVFSVLDPVATFTLPPFQVACGLTDTFIHVLEQYLTVCGESRVMDRWAEGILQSLVEIAPKIRENQQDYDLMADFMMCATMGLNGFIAMGVTEGSREETIAEIERRFNARHAAYGEARNVTGAVARQILEAC